MRGHLFTKTYTFTHMKKKANSVTEHCSDVREVEASFFFSSFFFSRGFPRGSVTTHVWESQKPKIKNAPFGSLVFGVENGRNTYS